MGVRATIWQKVALQGARAPDPETRQVLLPVELGVATEQCDYLTTKPTGKRILATSRQADAWSFAPWDVLASDLAAPGVRVAATEPHIASIGAYGMVGIHVTPVVLAEAAKKGRMPIAAPPVVRVHVNGPMPPAVGPTDVALQLVRQSGFDGFSGHVLEFTGDAIESMRPFQRAELLAAATLTGCVSSTTAMDTKALKAAKRLGLHGSPSVQEMGRFQADEEAVYKELVVINAADLEPLIANPRAGWVRPVAALSGRKLGRVITGGCVGGDPASVDDLARRLSQERVAGGLDFVAVAGSKPIANGARAAGVDAAMLESGARFLPPSKVPTNGVDGPTLSAHTCWSDDDLVASVPTLVASGSAGRIRAGGGYTP